MSTKINNGFNDSCNKSLLMENEVIKSEPIKNEKRIARWTIDSFDDSYNESLLMENEIIESEQRRWTVDGADASYDESLLIKNEVIESEQRKHKRRLARWTVVGIDKSGRKFKGITENVSQSGLLLTIFDKNGYCSLDKSLKINLEISVFYKGMSRRIDGVALIRHSVFTKEGKKLGVEFIKIKELERKFLNTYAVNKI
jgi:hypothetical protein